VSLYYFQKPLCALLHASPFCFTSGEVPAGAETPTTARATFFCFAESVCALSTCICPSTTLKSLEKAKSEVASPGELGITGSPRTRLVRVVVTGAITLASVASEPLREGTVRFRVLAAVTSSAISAALPDAPVIALDTESGTAAIAVGSSLPRSVPRFVQHRGVLFRAFWGLRNNRESRKFSNSQTQQQQWSIHHDTDHHHHTIRHRVAPHPQKHLFFPRPCSSSNKRKHKQERERAKWTSSSTNRRKQPSCCLSCFLLSTQSRHLCCCCSRFFFVSDPDCSLLVPSRNLADHQAVSMTGKENRQVRESSGSSNNKSKRRSLCLLTVG
jgi:hypothetical protein